VSQDLGGEFAVAGSGGTTARITFQRPDPFLGAGDTLLLSPA